MPKISIIIPCYNAEKTLDRAMRSLEYQTIGINNLEILLYCDLSTDNTKDVIMKWANKYPNIILPYISVVRQYQGILRNQALERCTGEYIAFLDADDWFEEDALEKVYYKATEFDADIVEFNFEMVYSEKYQRPDRAGEDKSKHILTAKDRAEFVLTSNFVRCCWDKVYKTEFIKKHDFKFATQVYDEESLFTVPAYFLAERIYYINETLYCYFQNVGGSSAEMMQDKAHTRDNENVWLQIYDRAVKDGTLQTDYQLFEMCFLINYYFYSVTMAEGRGFEYSEEEKIKLAQNVKKLFPNYLENKLINRKIYDLNELTRRI